MFRKLLVISLSGLLACSGGSAKTLDVDGGPRPAPGAPAPAAVKVAPLAQDEAAYESLTAQAAEAEKLDAAGLRARYPTNFRAALSYDPNSAASLDLIQGSALGLTAAERAKVAKNGFVISTRNSFPTFLYGLAQIYSDHLPLFVSADSLLESVHSSYDKMLSDIEEQVVVEELRTLLTNMRSRLSGVEAMDAKEAADLDLYLSVALSLLNEKLVTPVAGANPKQLAELVAKANAAEGLVTVTLFGVQRDEDFSQFKPRGHYADNSVLSPYFRAQMWLGRIDFRLIETVKDKQVFRRPQYLAMLALRDLMGEDVVRYQRIDAIVRTFVGDSDYMVPEEVDKLVADFGGAEAARAASDQQVASAIIAGDYGKQLIASHIAYTIESGTLPLNRSFALLGQRYIVDSQVFSDVSHDRVRLRMMPSPLDAAFAALGNAQALALHPQLDFPKLAGALGRSRTLIDAHDQSFWNANFYSLWLTALRALSPGDQAGLPEVVTTEAWGRRLLNTQLGSWAELRHDTLLYAKQSYSGIPECEYPDAYIDPYPAFYRALKAYADAGTRIVALLDSQPALAQKIGQYFDRLKQASSTLGDMAARELRGEPFSAEQMTFINNAVRIETRSAGCVSVEVPDGWYADLFYQPDVALEFSPTIADVHTQPADEGGAIVGKVLHVGTGQPRLMVTTVDTCNGPRAYAGVVFAYHELVTEDFERLTDEQWSNRFSAGKKPADVSWMSDLLAP